MRPISELGISKIYFHECKGAMDSDIYVKECITKRLLPFINQHKGRRVIFWPDLASSHYSAKTLAKLNELLIPIVPKLSNPPNCPNLRPIETFWSHLKAKVYADGYVAQDTKSLILRIKSKIKNFDSAYFARLMKNLKYKVNDASINGISYIK